jgi:hypothetical protein
MPAAPKPKTDDGPARTDEEIAESVEEELDELDGADVETPDGTVTDDPFDGTEEVDLDLAETDVGEPVDDDDAPAEEPSSTTDSTRGTSERGGFDGVRDEEPSPFGAEDDSIESGAIEENLNSGAARLAVTGLQEEFEINGQTQTKDDLQEEFEEVFEAFRLGHYGSEVAQEYILVDDEQVDPIWGFAASSLLCVAMVMWMRPDGDEMVSSIKRRMNSEALST